MGQDTEGRGHQEGGPANHLPSLPPDLLRLVLRDSQPLPVAAHLWGPRGQHVQRQEAYGDATPPLLHFRRRLPRHAHGCVQWGPLGLSWQGKKSPFAIGAPGVLDPCATQSQP